jgi:hypothetical protein
MSTRGHRNFLEKLTRAVFGSPLFRSRAVRWPLAAFLAALAIHSVTSGAALEGQDKGVATPAILFLFSLFLILLPLLPVADSWEEDEGGD